MIKLSKSDYEKILHHAESELPNEACGLIGGVKEGSDKIIKKVYLLTNIDHSNEHFSLDPKEQLAAIKDMRAEGLVPLGNWHSHPESPSRPSDEDKRLAYDKTASYMILSLMNKDEPVLNSFHIEGTDSTKEELVIEQQKVGANSVRPQFVPSRFVRHKQKAVPKKVLLLLFHHADQTGERCSPLQMYQHICV